MTQYLLSIYQPDGPAPAGDVLDRIGRDLDVLNADLRAGGSWVFTGGLHGPHASTVVRARPGDPPITDGPYVEGKEHVGGFYVIDVPDLDAALVWARRVSEATTLPVEVRPFQDSPAS